MSVSEIPNYKALADAHLAQIQATGTEPYHPGSVDRDMIRAALGSFLGETSEVDDFRYLVNKVNYYAALDLESDSEPLTLKNSGYIDAVQAINKHRLGFIDLGVDDSVIDKAIKNLAYLVKKAEIQVGAIDADQAWLYVEQDLAQLPLWFRMEVFALHQYHNASGGVDTVVRMTENPDFAQSNSGDELFPGRITLEDHDVVHLLTSQNQSMYNEAVTIGITMGSTGHMTPQKTAAYLYMAQNWYKKSYRFKPKDALPFWYAVQIADKATEEGLKDLSRYPYAHYDNCYLSQLREDTGVTPELFLGTKVATDAVLKVLQIDGATVRLVDLEIHKQVERIISSDIPEGDKTSKIEALLKDASFEFCDDSGAVLFSPDELDSLTKSSLDDLVSAVRQKVQLIEASPRGVQSGTLIPRVVTIDRAA